MGRSFAYSDEELQFLKANCKMLRTELHAQFQEKFNREVTLAALNSVCKRNGWHSGRKAKGGSHYAPEVLQFLSDHRDMPRKELVEAVNSKFGLSMTYDAVTNQCVKRGFSSKLTGRFGEHDGWRKAHESNEKPIGYETKPDARGRVYVKVGQPSQYKLKHHVIYEEFFGRLPDHYIIKFKDGDDTNFDLDNLIAIHRGATGFLVRRYKHHEASKEMKPLLLTMAQIDHKIYEKEKLK